MSIMTSCSDDDEPSTDEIKTNIVGMWQPVHISGYMYDDTEDENIIKVNKDIVEGEGERMRFYADGTCRTYWYSSNYGWQSWSSQKYEVIGNKIRVYTSKGELDVEYKVLSLKDNATVLEYHLDEGTQYTAQVTCKKVD